MVGKICCEIILVVPSVGERKNKREVWGKTLANGHNCVSFLSKIILTDYFFECSLNFDSRNGSVFRNALTASPDCKVSF